MLRLLTLCVFLLLGECNKPPLDGGSQDNFTGNTNNPPIDQKTGNSQGTSGSGSSGNPGSSPGNSGNNEDGEIEKWVNRNGGGAGLSFQSYAGWPVGDLRRYDFCTNDRGHLTTSEREQMLAILANSGISTKINSVKDSLTCKAVMVNYFDQLTVLDISGHNLAEITVLTQFKAVRDLNLSSNNLDIRIVPVLLNMTNLQTLSLRNNNLTNVSGLEQLSSLTKLDLGQNKLQTVDSLAKMFFLKFLDLSGNQIGQVASLSSLHNLSINVSGNPGIVTQYDTATEIDRSKCSPAEVSITSDVKSYMSCSYKDLQLIFNYTGKSTGWWGNNDEEQDAP